MKIPKLEAYQRKTVNDVLEKFKTHPTICLAYYTGSGKTNIFLEICREMITENPNIRIGISSYLTTEVKTQTFERAQLLGLGDESVLINNKSHINNDGNIFVFNPQTVYKIKPKDKFDLIIIDECHAGLGEKTLMLPRILNNICKANRKVLLVSATPWDALALKKFEGAPVFIRSLSDGIKDGRVADVEILCEESQLMFDEKDFNRVGDLATSYRHISLLKSECLGKMKNLLSRYGDNLGEKVLVICPPGNTGEIAREMATEFGGLALIEKQHWDRYDTGGNLEKFINGDSRFLFVINKCQVGFDMPELDTVIDLTMTRNIKNLVQRLGRVARKCGGKSKKYFYVYDKSITPERLEWLIGTTIDFSLGNFDGWTSKTTTWRKLHLVYRFKPTSIRLSEVINALAKKTAIKNSVALAYTQNTRPTFRTLPQAIAQAKEYKSRIDLFKRDPSLYKFFRTKGHLDELEKIHPRKNQIGKWNATTVEAEARKYTGRKEFEIKAAGARSWIDVNKRRDILDTVFGKIKPKWSDERATSEIKSMTSWSDLRKKSGLRGWLMANGKLTKYKKMFLEKNPKATISYQQIAEEKPDPIPEKAKMWRKHKRKVN